MDANETLETINEHIMRLSDKDETGDERLKLMQAEKTNWEIEKPKVETEYIRMETEKLKND